MKAPLKPIPRPNLATKKLLLEWARAEISAGVTRGSVCRCLMAQDPTSSQILAAENAIGGVMVDRNLKGKDREKAGKLDQAIRLYEANVADEDPGSHPYDRLVRIYAGLDRWVDVKRVRDAFLRLPGQLEKVREDFTTRHAKTLSRVPVGLTDSEERLPPLP